MGKIGFAETSVMNYNSTLRNIAEKGRSHGLIMEDFIFITIEKRAGVYRSRFVASDR
jgi:hypothetical protein